MRISKLMLLVIFLGVFLLGQVTFILVQSFISVPTGVSIPQEEKEAMNKIDNARKFLKFRHRVKKGECELVAYEDMGEDLTGLVGFYCNEPTYYWVNPVVVNDYKENNSPKEVAKQ